MREPKYSINKIKRAYELSLDKGKVPTTSEVELSLLNDKGGIIDNMHRDSYKMLIDNKFKNKINLDYSSLKKKKLSAPQKSVKRMLGS